MTSGPPIDPAFDFNEETPPGRDADSVSPTLRSYHRLLWSKPLRSGATIELFEPPSRRNGYLVNTSATSPVLHFGSDAITHSYSRWSKPKALADSIASLDEAQRARYLFPPYTIGSAMVWPVRFANKPTMNQARGTRHRIADRIDLTLECLRRYYIGRTDSPLADVLTAYSDFFDLFEDFDEFIEFFHYQDLVKSDGGIRYMIQFDEFSRHGAPQSKDEYIAYREATLQFIEARGERMRKWAARNISQG